MIVKIDKSFQKDVKKIQNKKIRHSIAEIIIQIQKADSLEEILNLKKLKGSGIEYRIKLRDYRIGLIISESQVEFVRFLHRKDIYKYFP